MKNWRNIVIFTLILAMPLSSWANVMVVSHCNSPDNTSHSMHSQMDGDTHMNHQMPTADLSDHSDCDCGCDGNSFCSVSGCNVSALSYTSHVNPVFTVQSVHQSVKILATPVELSSLFKPPISLS